VPAAGIVGHERAKSQSAASSHNAAKAATKDGFGL